MILQHTHKQDVPGKDHDLFQLSSQFSSKLVVDKQSLVHLIIPRRNSSGFNCELMNDLE
jgi:hypothetical protein